MNPINQLFFKDLVVFLTENLIVNEESKNRLNQISKSYYNYIIHLDNLIDNEIKIEEDLLQNNPLVNLTNSHELCVKLLVKLYGENSTIFESKAKYSKMYFDALIKEKLWNFDSHILTKENFEDIALEKHIPVYFIVDGIQLLQNNYPSEEIKKMLAHIFRGIQMYDDITDIADDLDKKQFTYIISSTIQRLKADQDYYPENNLYTHKAFFALEDLSNPQFDYMIEQFSLAKKIANIHRLTNTIQWINAITEQINDWKTQIEEIRNA